MRIRTSRVLLAALLATFTTAAGMAQAAPKSSAPKAITSQGRLFDTSSNPISGTLDVVFAIYDKADATTPIWSEHQSVTFDQGFYSASLGAVVPLDEKTFDGSVRYFGITIGTDAELLPRAAIQSVPYALFAGDVRGDIHPSSISIDGGVVIDETGKWVGKPLPPGPAGP